VKNQCSFAHSPPSQTAHDASQAFSSCCTSGYPQVGSDPLIYRLNGKLNSWSQRFFATIRRIRNLDPTPITGDTSQKLGSARNVLSR
jgi:hypothetical protein